MWTAWVTVSTGHVTWEGVFPAENRREHFPSRFAVQLARPLFTVFILTFFWCHPTHHLLPKNRVFPYNHIKYTLLMFPFCRESKNLIMLSYQHWRIVRPAAQLASGPSGKAPTVRRAHVMKQETKKCRKQLPRLSLTGHVPSEKRSVKMGVTTYLQTYLENQEGINGHDPFANQYVCFVKL